MTLNLVDVVVCKMIINDKMKKSMFKFKATYTTSCNIYLTNIGVCFSYLLLGMYILY